MNHSMELLTWSFLLAVMCQVCYGQLDSTTTSTQAPSSPVTQNNTACALVSQWLTGDPKRCKDFMKANGFGIKLDLGVIPGYGWDNIRNEVAGLVVSQTYRHCRLTDDSQMLIPDNVFSSPLKYCRQETMTESFNTWLDTTSTTAKSINLDASASLPYGISISGSFSSEKAEMRSQMMRTGGLAVRTQIRVDKYDVWLKPDSEFSPEFENRLKSIATNIQLNYLEMAKFEAQMLVRDFGTHVVSRIKAGATLIATSFVKRSFTGKMNEAESMLKLSAAASGGFGLYHAKVSLGGHSAEKQKEQEELTNNTAHSAVDAKGGDQNIVAHLTGVNVTQWIRGVDKNLVAIDRAGDPIYLLITTRALPMIPAPMVRKVASVVHAAVESYYSQNAISGCTDIRSPSFNPFANVVDNNQCGAEMKRRKWGGIFIKSTCTPEPNSYEYKHLWRCHVDNVISDHLGCPSHFKAVHLMTYEVNDTAYCNSPCVNELYWCVKIPGRPFDWGLRVYFGGIFSWSLNKINPVTGKYGCPLQFHQQYLTKDYRICLTQVEDDAIEYAVPFGGFQSCKSANTMADNSSRYGCPIGYLPFPIENEHCLMHYCLQQNKVPGRTFVKRPPFVKRPAEIVISNYKWGKAELAEAPAGVPLVMVAGMAFLTMCCIFVLFILVVVYVTKVSHRKKEPK